MHSTCITKKVNNTPNRINGSTSNKYRRNHSSIASSNSNGHEKLDKKDKDCISVQITLYQYSRKERKLVVVIVFRGGLAINSDDTILCLGSGFDFSFIVFGFRLAISNSSI